MSNKRGVGGSSGAGGQGQGGGQHHSHPHQQQGNNPSVSPAANDNYSRGGPNPMTTRRPRNLHNHHHQATSQEHHPAPSHQNQSHQHQGGQGHRHLHANNITPPLLNHNKHKNSFKNNTLSSSPPPPTGPMSDPNHHSNRPPPAEDEENRENAVAVDGVVNNRGSNEGNEPTLHQVPLSNQLGGDRNLLFGQQNTQIENVDDENRLNNIESSTVLVDDDLLVLDPEIEESTTLLNDLPENVIETLFTYLELSDIRNCETVCSYWSRILDNEDSEVWRCLTLRKIGREVAHSELLSVCKSYRAKLRAFYFAWNPHDCSRNIYIKPNSFTLHRNPVAQSTDGVRSKRGFNRGRHAWELVWEGPLGTVAVVGIATRRAEMRAAGYIALLGQDDQSWGWNLVENVLLHNGESQSQYPLINNPPRYQMGEKLRVILDCDDGTLSFEKNRDTNVEFLGVAFHGLPRKEYLYPAISAVYGNTEVSMIYLGPPLDG